MIRRNFKHFSRSVLRFYFGPYWERYVLLLTTSKKVILLQTFSVYCTSVLQKIGRGSYVGLSPKFACPKEEEIKHPSFIGSIIFVQHQTVTNFYANRQNLLQRYRKAVEDEKNYMVNEVLKIGA